MVTSRRARHNGLSTLDAPASDLVLSPCSSSFTSPSAHACPRGTTTPAGLGILVRRRKVTPLAPAVKIDERLHAAPLHDLTLEPDVVHRLG